MPVVVIANPKGGVGKTTLATNVAGYFASRGRAVMLGDADRQQSSRLWLGLRPAAARPIATWEVNAGQIVKPPKGTTHVVLDSPGGLHGRHFDSVIKLAGKVIVPLQPSVFDIFATRAFLDQLAEHRHAGKMQVGIVGVRVDARLPRTSCANLSRAWGCRCSVMCAIRKTTFTWRRAALRSLTWRPAGSRRIWRNGGAFATGWISRPARPVAESTSWHGMCR